MKIISQFDLKEALDEVDSANSSAMVLSPFGFTIKEIGGKRHVVAMTEEEAKEVLAVVTPTVTSLGDCLTTSNGTCVQHTCTRKCVPVFTDKGWVCYCGF